MRNALSRIFVCVLVAGAGSRARAQCVVQEIDTSSALASGTLNRISLHGDELLVASGGGAAFVYELRSGEWVQSARFFPSDGAWNVRSVELHDGVAAVASDAGTGGVYVFEKQAHGWKEVERLRPFADASSYEWATLALTDGVLVVGDRFDDTLSPDAGALQVYERNAEEWREAGTLVAPDGGIPRGRALAVDGMTVLASTYSDVQVFDRTDAGWSQSSSIHFDARWEDFGHSVALSGERALVGARSETDGGSGSAYLFLRRGADWELEAELAPTAAAAGDDFGWSVDLDGTRAVVGSVGYLGSKGRALLFEERTGGWHEIAVLLPVYEPTGSTFFFGHSVSVSGGNAAASDGAHPHVYGDFECAAAVEYCVATPNSTGSSARIRHAGSLRVSENAFELRASHCPSGEIGFFFYGAPPAQIPFEAGYLCVEPGPTGYFRFPPQLTDYELTRRLIDFTAPPADSGPGQIAAGSTWYFQFVFRDGASVDFTEGLRVLFGP